MKTLQEIYKNYTTPDGNGDKGTAHSYIEVYSDLLEKYRNCCTFLEIGVSDGLSMKMWSEYFLSSKLYGVDIKCSNLELRAQDYFTFIESNATKEDFLKKIQGVDFDVIIDDGSHNIKDQITSFNLLKNKLKSGGLYVIEDVENLDKDKQEFVNLQSDDFSVEILDRRNIKNRKDDVLIVIRRK